MSENSYCPNRRQALLAGAGLVAAPMLYGSTAQVAVAKAPMLGPARPTHHRFKIGKFEVTAIADGAVKVPKVHPIFGQNQTPQAVSEQLKANFLPSNQMAIPFTPIIVNTGRELVLFDTGNGAARRGKGAGLLASALVSAGFTPDQFDIVVITHFHPDHIGGLMEDGKPLFPNARYITGEVEYNFWSPKEKAEGDGALAKRAKLVQSNVVPFAEKMSFLKPEGEVTAGIRAVEAFGHTPGHMAYHVESGNSRLLIMADTTNHYVASLQKPDWHVIFDMDKQQAVAARKRLLDMAAADRVPTTGYHMPFPAVGYIERQNDAFRWVPVSYQFDL